MDPNRQVGLARILMASLLAAALVVPMAGAGAAQDMELVGQVMVEHGDDFSGKRAEFNRVLETESGRFVLTGPRSNSLDSGMRVRVRGKRSGNTLLLGDSSSVTVLSTGSTGQLSGSNTATSTTATSPIAKRVAVLLINFTTPTASPTPTPTPAPSASSSPGSSPFPTPSPSPTPVPPKEPWTKDAVRALYFTNQKSVASYFREVSDTRLSMTGDVFGYFTLAMPTTSCDYGAWGSAARQAATAAGIDLSGYTNVVHAFGKLSSCWWGGLAQVQGSLSWINGSMTLYVTSHELGHNFGAHHASTMTCTQGGVRVPLSSNCTVDEYGDPFDVMGTSAQRHVNAWHRRQVGFLGTADQLTVTANGRYFMATSQVAGGAPRIVRVARSSSEYYYLEFRQPYGLFDNFSSTAQAVNGVMVRIAPDSKRLPSTLLDMNPATTGFGDAPLGVGQTFTDPASGLSISTVSISAAGATVRIQVGPDTVPPGSPGALTATTSAPEAVRLSWTAASDDLEVSGYRVTRDGVVLATTAGTTWTDSGLAQGVTYSYSVEALDGALNAGSAAVVTHHLPDTVAPAPPPSAEAVQSAARSVSLSWAAATDNVGVVGYRVLRDGSLLATTETTTLEDAAVMDGFTYEYSVQALDAAGNAGTGASASVSLPDVTAPTPPTTVQAGSLSATSVQLSWQAGTDNVAVTGYQVTRDGTSLATLPATATTLTDTGLTSDRTYVYGITAFDAAGNASSEATAQVTLVSKDTLAPSVPQELSGQPLGKRRVGLSWQASTDDRPGTIRYRIFRNDVALVTVTTTSYVDRPATVARYTYKVRAIDAAGNKSAFTPAVTVKAKRVL